MRQIKFRGYNEAQGWVYGNLLMSEVDIQGNCVCEIHTPFADSVSVSRCFVDPKSVGQWTGLKDKNGKDIYEGDIVTGWRKGSNSDRGYTGVIEWRFEQAGWVIKCSKYILEILSLAQSGWAAEPYNIHQLDSFEVIGNIYESPELLTK